MKFHEDVIFKIHGQEYAQKLLELIKIDGKVLNILQTEYGVVDPKMYKPDLVFELEDKIIILEFQSTPVYTNDKRRFRFYTAIIDHVKVKSSKPIEVHVLSTVEGEIIKWYNVSKQAAFPIYIHSLKKINGEKFLNRMNEKIEHNESITEKELIMISLLCFMETLKDQEQTIWDSAVTITNIKGLGKEIAQFAKGIILMLCDKFVKNESLNKSITNIVGGNMKVVEEYAQRKVDEKVNERNEVLIHKLKQEGYGMKDIARLADVSLDFVEKTLSK